ncbi:ILVBL protein, partial [Orthonyx spaldingii]|nr:ILVBL protein [Orthonyx spaldingii]
PPGRIGVAAVTAGPGVTNAVTAVKNAQMAESPLLLLGGAAATLQKGRGALQDIPQVPLFRTLCKAALSVRAVRGIVPTLRRAIATAMEGTPGERGWGHPKISPGWGLGSWNPEIPVERSLGWDLGSFPWIWGFWGYLQNYIRDLFAGAWEPRDPTPLPLRIPTAPPEQV